MDKGLRWAITKKEEIRKGISHLQNLCFCSAVEAGWHSNIKTGQPYTEEEQDELFPVRIALIHSEVSEALEGFRKGLMDDHLVNREMSECEIADVVIRCMDLAGAMGYDLSSAILEKIHYNKSRADHKIENRTKEGGKKF